ncbi:MAG: NAD-dependent deacetylase [Patiriisocius sp.]|jgi:NAD-dependent deacetylase
MKSNKKLVVLTGAGMSAESGLKTFRDNDGLWENHNIYEVATPEAWQSNPELVNKFYNQRRAQLGEVYPNDGHKILAELEATLEVSIITQNVDDLHERAGSSEILHLHGELTKVRCTHNPKTILDVKYKALSMHDLGPNGHPLRPHIVWFGEAVPLIEVASEIVRSADILCIIGTSMQVYPAAGLVDFAEKGTPVYCINPDEGLGLNKAIMIPLGASEGMIYFKNKIIPTLLDT